MKKNRIRIYKDLLPANGEKKTVAEPSLVFTTVKGGINERGISRQVPNK